MEIVFATVALRVGYAFRWATTLLMHLTNVVQTPWRHHAVLTKPLRSAIEYSLLLFVVQTEKQWQYHLPKKSSATKRAQWIRIKSIPTGQVMHSPAETEVAESVSTAFFSSVGLLLSLARRLACVAVQFEYDRLPIFLQANVPSVSGAPS